MKERLRKQRRERLIRAGIQLLFFLMAPSLFSTAFAGIKSIFLAVGAREPVTWNSFLDITAALLLVTCLFGRHFCGYACAFGALGDLLYGAACWIWQKIFRKKTRPGYPQKVVYILQKVKYLILAVILLFCVTGNSGLLAGKSPWDVFSMLTAHRMPGEENRIGIRVLLVIMVGMCTQERFFCQFLCPMGAVFAMMPIIPGALFRRRRERCGKKCSLCQKRCPVHLEIDGDTARSGECICCHACLTTCPKGNIVTGDFEEGAEE